MTTKCPRKQILMSLGTLLMLTFPKFYSLGAADLQDLAVFNPVLLYVSHYSILLLNKVLEQGHAQKLTKIQGREI